MSFRSKSTLTFLLVLILSLSAASMALAKAFTEGEQFIEEIDFFEYVECAAGGAGEWVVFTGKLHDMYRVTLDENGGFHMIYLSQPMGVSGVGETTGDVYRGTGALVEQQNYGLVGETSTWVWRYHLIGPGKGNNLYMDETFHFTVNANGELTAEVTNWSAECK
jgi:hypothetical protein